MMNDQGPNRALSDSYSVTTEELLVNRPGDYCIRYWVMNDEQPGPCRALSDSYSVTTEELLVNRLGQGSPISFPQGPK